jgi:hypothetical protein
MIFSDLTFSTFDPLTRAMVTFANDWQVSVVAGPEGFGVYGITGQDTFEVAVFTPNGNMLEDPLYYQTPAQITTILRVVEML